MSIQLLLTLSLVLKLQSKSIDFMLAYPQADLDVNIFMELPPSFYVAGASWREFVLKLCKNLYGLKQVGLNWYEHLQQGLLKCEFIQSQINPCIYYKNGLILLVYVDNCLLFSR